jgi:hypothetical protein
VRVTSIDRVGIESKITHLVLETRFIENVGTLGYVFGNLKVILSEGLWASGTRLYVLRDHDLCP